MNLADILDIMNLANILNIINLADILNIMDKAEILNIIACRVQIFLENILLSLATCCSMNTKNLVFQDFLFVLAPEWTSSVIKNY